MSEQFIDINDLGLEEEALEGDFNPNANEFAGFALLPKGRYIGSLQFREQDPSKQFIEKDYSARSGKSGKYEATKLVTIVTDPDEYAKRRVFDDFVSTGIWNSDSSKISSILHLLGRSQEVTEARTHRDLSRALANAVAGQPVIGVVVDWEGRVKNTETGEYEDLYKTMTQFRQKEDGTYDPEIKDGEGNVIGKARLRVVKYFAAPSGASAVAG